MSSARPTTPSTNFWTRKPPLLDVSACERGQIIAGNIIWGFSILSGITNFIASNISSVSAFLHAGTSSALTIFGGVTVAGGVAGGVAVLLPVDRQVQVKDEVAGRGGIERRLQGVAFAVAAAGAAGQRDQEARGDDGQGRPLAVGPRM